MTFYHGTSKENWELIKSEGVLYGRRYVLSESGFPLREVDRYTYLAVDLEEAKCYGDIVLQVEYDPFKRGSKNNYCEGCWQVRVYEPIPITNVKQMV